MREKQASCIAFVIFFTLIAVLRHDAFQSPAFWDETFFIEQSHGFYVDAIHRSMLTFYHPAFLQFAVGAFLKIVGWKLSVFRWVCFVIGAGFITAFFQLARTRLPLVSSVFLALALLCSPVFLSECALFNPDLPAAAFALVALTLLLRGRALAGSLAFGLAAAMNGPILILTPALAFFFIGSKYAGRRFLLFLAPAAAVTAAWIAFYLGVLAMQGGFDSQGLVPTHDWHTSQLNWDNISTLGKRFYQLLIVDGRAALALAFCLLVSLFRFFRREWIPFIAIIGTQLITFAYVGTGCERYLFVGIASLFWLVGSAAQPFLSRQAGVAAFCALAVFFSAYEFRQWETPGRAGFPYDNRHAYLQHVALIATAASDLKLFAKPTTLVFTHWPLQDAFERPELGYVARPLPGVYQDIGDAGALDSLKAALAAGRDVVFVAEPQTWRPEILLLRTAFEQAAHSACFIEEQGPLRMLLCHSPLESNY